MDACTRGRMYAWTRVRVDATTDQFNYLKKKKKKSRIQETKNLSTDADSRTDIILERFRHFLGPLLAATFGVLF